MAMLNAELGANVEIGGTAVPEWHFEHSRLLRKKINAFVDSPTKASLSALVTACVAYLSTYRPSLRRDRPFFLKSSIECVSNSQKKEVLNGYSNGRSFDNNDAGIVQCGQHNCQ